MKIPWSPRQLMACSRLREVAGRPGWQDLAEQLYRYWQAWLALLAWAVIAGVGRSLGMGHPGGLLFVLAGAQCYWRACLYLMRGHYRRLRAGPRTAQPHADPANSANPAPQS